ncbi:MAG: hypothetical protein K2K69_00255, partial [Muribaculaceae bacterium]|nr:hypothetical protein [Muribaculaceae bacterium]
NQSRALSLDIIANSVADNWQRPVYFATTVPSSYYLGLSPFLSGAGMAYEVTPYVSPAYSPTAEKTYRKILTDYRWGGLDGPNADKLYLDETVRRMVSSVRSGVFTTIEDLMQTGDLPASAASREAARNAGLEEPETLNDMARQLLQTIESKLPGNVSPNDSMIGLYMARAYYDLYLADGNKADLEAAERLIAADVHRYAQLVKYASTLDYNDFNLLGRSEMYALQYLGEAVALQNRIDILKAKPELLDNPDYERVLTAMSLEDDLRLAPMMYIHGYDDATLVGELDNYNGSSRELVEAAITLHRANSEAGVDPMAFSRDLMNRYGFSEMEWDAVLR